MNDNSTSSNNLSDMEFLRILGLLEQMRAKFGEQVDAGQTDPDWRMIAALIGWRIADEPITISSLIQVSGIPYGTAQRRIHAMIDAGLIEKKFRSDTKKSFFLLPSAKLFADFSEYVSQMKALLARTVGARGAEGADEYYFGGAGLPRDVPPPIALQRKLNAGGRPLTFLLNDDNYFAAMRNMWSDYRNNLGSRKNFTLKPLPDLHSELKDSFASDRQDFDVVALNIPWLGEFADAGHLQALDAYITEENIRPSDYHQSVWSTGKWNGRQYGIPIYVTVEAMAIRHDLFDERGFDAPRTFDQVIDIGRQFHDPAREFYGIAWNAARGMPVASTFMILMGCCGASIFDLQRNRRYHEWADLTGDQLRPRIDCDDARIALDYMRRLMEISPPDILEMDWDRRISAFLNGEVAMGYCWTMRAARFDRDVHSVVKSKAKFIPQPKSPSGTSQNPIGGFLLAVPANLPEARAQLAFEAISWMASPEAMKSNATNGLPVAPRFSVAADPEISATSPIVRFVDKLAKRNMLCTWQRPPIPEYRQIEFILGDRIHAALSGELSVNEALAMAQVEVDQLMRQAARY